MAPLTLMRRHPSRGLAIVAVALLGLLVLLIGTRSAGQATSGGDAYSVPLVTDTNPDPNIVETTIIADEATVDIGNGVMAQRPDLQRADPGPSSA